MNNTKWSINTISSYLIIPVIITIVLIFNPDRTASLHLKGVIHLILQSIFIYGILSITNKYKILKIIFSLFLVLSLASILSYKSFPTAGIIMSVLSTSFSEAYAFIKFNLYDVSLSIFFFFALVLLPIGKNKFVNIFMLLIGSLYTITPSIVFALSNTAIPYDRETAHARGLSEVESKIEYFYSKDMAYRFPVLKSVKGFSDTLQFLKLKNQGLASSWTDVQATNNSSNILIIGLGESLRKDHLGVYGYKRNTTPYLASIKNDLHIYDNAYSGGTNTWTSVPAMFTRFNGYPDLTKSIIHLANDAGYETHWISNQTKISTYDFSVSSLALQSIFSKFSTNHTREQMKYDEVLLPKLIETLSTNKPNKKILVILHFFGSHMLFNERYPDKFERFTSGQSQLEKSIDQYDNSVLYTDYILSKVLKISSDYNAKFIYFSDHGLGKVNSDIPLKHDARNQPDIDSINVPLISSHDLNLTTSGPINLFYFECIFSDWSGITAKELNKDDCHKNLNSSKVEFYDSNLKLNTIKFTK